MTGLERIILLFDTDPTAFEFMREDGEGGFSGSIFRMAREIDRLRSARAADNIALQAEVERLRKALHSVIQTDHHNHYDGPPPRFVEIARAALNATPDTAADLPG